MGENRSKIGYSISPQRGKFDSKIQVEGVAPTNHFGTDS